MTALFMFHGKSPLSFTHLTASQAVVEAEPRMFCPFRRRPGGLHTFAFTQEKKQFKENQKDTFHKQICNITFSLYHIILFQKEKAPHLNGESSFNPSNPATPVRASYKATKTKVNYFNLVYFLLSNLPFQLAFDPSSSEEEGTKVSIQFRQSITKSFEIQ